MSPTLTTDVCIPFKNGGFTTLTQALDYAAQGETGINFFDSFGRLTNSLTYTQLREQALRIAAYLQKIGIKRKQRLALIAQTRAEFLAVFFACQYAGIIPCPIPFTSFQRGNESYAEKIFNLLKCAHAEILVIPENLHHYLNQTLYAFSGPIIHFEAINQFIRSEQTNTLIERLQPFGADEPAYIQFSSGSIAYPKGIAISQQSLHANIDAILKYGMKLKKTDRAFSWLPFYHDMGLVGFVLTSLCGQRSVDYLPPTSFARHPSKWLELMSQQKSSITYAPCFAYKLAAEHLKQGIPINLSNLRIAGIGGDMIHPETLKQVEQSLNPYGFKKSAFMPSYGLAEAALAVAISDQNAPLIDQYADHDGNMKKTVSCGRILPEYEIKIFDANKKMPLPEHEIGQVWIKGPSIISSYLNEPDKNLLDENGFLNTGDLGYLYQHQIFITGREKDLIIIRGRNIPAQDIEWTIEHKIKGIRRGSVAAFSVSEHDEDRLVIIVEAHKLNRQDKAELKSCIQNLITETFGVYACIIFVETNNIIMTSSGKISRAKTKENYLNHKLIEAS